MPHEPRALALALALVGVTSALGAELRAAHAPGWTHAVEALEREGADVVSRVAGVDDAFWDLLVSDAKDLPGVPDPLDLAALMFPESGINPTAKNVSPDGTINAIGINQLASINWKAYGITDPAAYLALSASAQWAHVVRPFFAAELRSHPEAAKSLRDLYWLNFEPAKYVPGAPDSYVIDPHYAGPGLADADGAVRAGSLLRFALAAQKEAPARWASIVKAVNDARGFADGQDHEETSAAAVSGGAMLFGVATAFVVATLLLKGPNR